MNKSTSRKYKLGLGWLLALALSLGIFSGGGSSLKADNTIKPGDFKSLKEAIEDRNRQDQIVVPGGNYDFTDTITVSKNLTLKNKPGETVNFNFHLNNNDSKKLGETMFDLVGGKLTILGESNQHIVFDGLGSYVLGDDPESQGFVTETNKTYTHDKGTFITVRKDAELEVDKATFTNSIIYGQQAAPIYLDGGKFTLKDGLITKNLVASQETEGSIDLSKRNDQFNGHSSSAGVGIRNQGIFIMNGGEISHNAATHGDGGGAISVTGGSATINGGKIQHNFAHRDGGGAIYVGLKKKTEVSEVVVNGGEFTKNESLYGGGAIFLDWGATGRINGGAFKENSAPSGGAIGTFDRYIIYKNNAAELNPNAQGIEHADWKYTYGFATKLTVDGGIFESNNASMVGGAIYISSDDTEINKAIIRNNTALRYGGGIYVSHIPYVLKLNNALIRNNTADGSWDVPVTMTGENSGVTLEQGSGGGIWYCPTGSSEVYVSNGAAFQNNSAGNSGDDFTSVANEFKKKVTIADRMLGGGYALWYVDGNNTDKNIPRYQAGDTPYDITSPQISSESVSLKAKAKEANAYDMAAASAKVIIEGNQSSRGGGIGTNGSVIFGDKDNEFNLLVKKDWSPDLDDQKEPVTIKLLAIYGDKEYIIDSVVLNKDNEWKHAFKKLPLQAGNKSIQYRVREVGDKFEVSYENNDYLAKSEAQGKNIEIRINNAPHPGPTKPTEPTEPTEPQPSKPIYLTETTGPSPSQSQSVPKPSVKPAPGLPATGESNNSLGIQLIGLALILGVAIVLKRKGA